MADFTQFSKNDEGTIEAILSGQGISNTGPFANLIDAAIRQNWTPEELTAHLYDTNAFKNMFPGIFRDDGSLMMSATEYRTMSDNYISTARMYGITGLDKQRIGALIGGNVSQQEFQDRATAIQRVESYRPAMEQFKQALKARGISTKGLDSDEDIANFILGKGPKQFYKIWEEATVGTAAGLAGINLNAKQTASIARKTAGVSTEAELAQQMQELAQNIKTILPMSQIQKMGLNKKDLEVLEFGGKGQDEIWAKAQNIVKSHKAFFEDKRAHEKQLQQSVTGNKQDQAQTY